MENAECPDKCDWKFNFPSIPNKAICKICHAKAELDLHTLEWMPIGVFKNEKRTDKELAKQWV